jgi:hypothetical protein
MQIRCSVSTYLLLNIPKSFPVASLAKAYQYWCQLPLGSVATEPTNNLSPETTTLHSHSQNIHPFSKSDTG